jgi:hypothetical protein
MPPTRQILANREEVVGISMKRQRGNGARQLVLLKSAAEFRTAIQWGAAAE